MKRLVRDRIRKPNKGTPQGVILNLRPEEITRWNRRYARVLDHKVYNLT